jgi:prophage antirepressor-like protein
LVKSESFGSVKCDFYENKNNDVFMTINQLAQALEYADKSGAEKIVQRNEYLKNREFSSTDRLSVPQGSGVSVQDTRAFTEDGIYEVTMLSNQPKAKEFRSWVRAILKSLRKGETILVQPQNEDAKLQIQRMRAEAMLNNSRTRQAKLILDMQKSNILSPVAVELLRVNALEVLTDSKTDYRPQIEKTYTATEIARELGVSANKIGKVANANNLKTDEYGIVVLDKSAHSSKQVESFRYNEKGRQRLKGLIGE